MNDTLRKVQMELKAPKNQYNPYGKYNYRNCEGILEAVKPLLEKHKANLTITDSIVSMEGRWYIKATAVFESEEGVEVVNGWAREPDARKGMDESQITGTASSYARKYALNGLFLIDDMKDADAKEHRDERDNREKEAEPPKETSKVGAEQIERLKKFADKVGVGIDTICERFGVQVLQDLTMEQYASAIRSLQKNAERMK